MVESTAAAGLLTASSVMVVGLSFAFDRIKVPRKKRAKGMLFFVMTIGYLSAVGCLYTVALPTTELRSLISPELLFKTSIGSMIIFFLTMSIALFPDEVSAIFK